MLFRYRARRDSLVNEKTEKMLMVVTLEAEIIGNKGYYAYCAQCKDFKVYSENISDIVQKYKECFFAETGKEFKGRIYNKTSIKLSHHVTACN